MFRRKADKCNCCQQVGSPKRMFIHLAICRDVDACLAVAYAS